MPYPKVDPLDWSTVQPHVDALLARELTSDSVQDWLQQWSDLEAVLYETAAGIQRAVSENTADKEAERRFLLMVEHMLPQMKLANQALRDKLSAFGDYSPPADQQVMLRRFRAESSIFRPENVPLESELEKLSNQYDKIIGAMSIEWDRQTEAMPQAMLHLRDGDRAIRESAWRLIMGRWLAERAKLSDLYLQMLALRRRVARNAGLANYRDYQWQMKARFDYTPQDCATFHDAIEHTVAPLAERLYRNHAGKLGVDSIRPWDTEADPCGEPLRPFHGVSELEDGVQRIFQAVDPAVARSFAALRDGFLDLGTRLNKAPGGYCSMFPVSRKPYIFMSAVGTHDDVGTLLHEGGHALHTMEAFSQPLIWNQDAPAEFAEVASMGMELLAAPYLARSRGGFYSEADARRARAEQLRSIVRMLPYIAVVDAFQHWVYVDAPEDVSAAALDARWSELWERFMQGIDYGGLKAQKETGWQRKLHIFQVPFYYVEYGLAQLGALQVWRNAQHDQADAVARYRSALALGYSKPLTELYRAAGARFAFDRATVGGLMELVEEQLQQLEE
jgi:oligoendopeptidase F